MLPHKTSNLVMWCLRHEHIDQSNHGLKIKKLRRTLDSACANQHIHYGNPSTRGLLLWWKCRILKLETNHNPISRGVACQLISRRGRGGVNCTPKWFLLQRRAEVTKTFQLSHTLNIGIFIGNKRENQNCLKIRSGARKIKISIMSNFSP